jgi:hypothetical protein
MNTGTCLCGDIAWEVDGDFTMLVNCHCSICRKVHGSACATFVATPADAFRWTSGEDKISYYASSDKGKRPFCPRCGSEVASMMGDAAFMPAGNMDGHIDRPLDSHIFVDDKACWFDITDDAPQFDGYPPGYDMETVPRPERQPKTEGAVGGSCDCGKVTYEFDGPAYRMGCCHCSRCRKARSSAYSTQAFVPIDSFRWLSGEDNLDHYKVEDSKYFYTTFCRECSSPMPRAFEEFDVFMVPAGSFDQDPGVRPQAHIYVTSKATWHEITDGLPQFDEMPPERA